MPIRDVLFIETRGERFRFYFDAEEPGSLHIWARHRMTANEAIRVFFEGEGGEWDPMHMRFETRLEDLTLYWTRHRHDDSVLVISCFRRTTRDG